LCPTASWAPPHTESSPRGMSESPAASPSKYNGNEIPGPGTYNHATDQRGGNYLGDAPAYSMGARKAVYTADGNSPGPVYSPEKIVSPTGQCRIGDTSNPNLFSFGNSKRFLGATTGGDPGPGQYPQSCTRTGTGMLGDAPKYGFGTSAQREVNVSPRGTRSSTGPRFISKEHAAKANFSIHSPGPLLYNPTEGLGVQLSGTGQPNSPRYTMRPRLANYQPPGGTAKGGPPGPGTYNAMTAFGAQSHSARATAASFGFGTSERHRPELQPKKTAYIGKEFERQNWGIHSPGPSMYATRQTIGPGAGVGQVKVSPSFSFGGESRFAY